MGDFGTSMIRSWTPILVGGLISWIASLGINLNAQTKEPLMIAATALISGVYYTIVRLLEQRFPKLGILLGIKAQPTYAATAPVAVSAPPVESPAPVVVVAPPVESPAPAPLVAPPVEPPAPVVVVAPPAP